MKPLLVKPMDESRFVLNVRLIWAGDISEKIGGISPKSLNLYIFLKLRNIWAKLVGFDYEKVFLVNPAESWAW